jgi:hypothetical protein
MFEIADPSIEQIFMERVGRSAREDVSLAGVPDAPGAARYAMDGPGRQTDGPGRPTDGSGSRTDGPGRPTDGPAR